MARLEVEIGAKIEGLLKELKKAKEGLSGIGVAADKLVAKLKRVGEKMSNIGKSMATFLTLPLAAIAGASIKMASDFTESLNKVDVAFKESAIQVREFAKTTLKTFGIAQGTALDMAALFGDMATSMGVPTDKAAILATEMVGLAGDMSSFKNIGIEEVTTALNGVFTGETESLKRLGIVMTIANLKTFALTQGMNDNIEAMTQAQKVQLRYAYILSVTKNAQGDFARTSEGSANQMRIFTESVKELSVSFGKVLLPLFTKVITQVNKIVKGFTALPPATKKIVVVIAALVAILGPLLIALGFLMTTVLPGLITAFVSLTGVIAANPFGLLAVAIAAVVSSFLMFNNNVDDTIEKQSLLTKINNTAAKSISNEKAKLVELLAIARHEGVSKKQRIKAIQEINNISPKYLGNLTLETINTDKARVAVDKYNKELLKTAKVKAAQSKLQEIQSKVIDIELKQAKELVDDAKKLIKLKEDAVTIEDRLKIKNLERIGFGKTSNGLQSAKLKLLNDEQDLLLGIITSNKINNEVVASSTPTRKKATALDIPQVGVSGNMGQESTLGTIAPKIDTTLFDEGFLMFKEKLNVMALATQTASNAIGQSFNNMTSGIKNNLTEQLGAMGSFLGVFVDFIGQMIQAQLQQFITEKALAAKSLAVDTAFTSKKLVLDKVKATSNAVVAASNTAAASGPASAILLPLLIGGAIAAIGSAFSGISGGGGGQTGSSNFSGSSGGGNFGASSGGEGGGDNVVFILRGTDLVGSISATLARNRSLGGSLQLT